MLDSQIQRFGDIWCVGRSSTAVDCGCGRVHVAMGVNAGDFEEGECESFEKKKEQQPDKYILEYNLDGIDYGQISGKVFVLGCPCGHDRKHAEWIDENADELAKYLKLLFADRIREATRQIDEMQSFLDAAVTP